MRKGRLEAFTDGVIAVIITIMVLEMKAPQGDDPHALRALLPAFLSYVLSFIYVGIYWNNHHHLFQLVERISGATLWANLHLLFWLSLVPIVTRWMGENHFSAWPVMLYGIVLFLCALAWEILRRVLLRSHASDSALARAMGNSRSVKESASLLLYGGAIGLAFVNAWISCAVYVLVAAMWFVPDRRVERELH
jgi:TMEM175 potassium channel family protein